VGTRRGRGLSRFCRFDVRGVVQGIGAGCREFLGRDRGAGILWFGGIVSGGGCMRQCVQAALSLRAVQYDFRLLCAFFQAEVRGVNRR
jgi:hypothetical protein